MNTEMTRSMETAIKTRAIVFCPFCMTSHESKEDVNVTDMRDSLGVIYYYFDCCNSSMVRTAIPCNIEV